MTSCECPLWNQRCSDWALSKTSRSTWQPLNVVKSGCLGVWVSGRLDVPTVAPNVSGPPSCLVWTFTTSTAAREHPQHRQSGDLRPSRRDAHPRPSTIELTSPRLFLSTPLVPGRSASTMDRGRHAVIGHPRPVGVGDRLSLTVEGPCPWQCTSRNVGLPLYNPRRIRRSPSSHHDHEPARRAVDNHQASAARLGTPRRRRARVRDGEGLALPATAGGAGGSSHGGDGRGRERAECRGRRSSSRQRTGAFTAR